MVSVSVPRTILDDHSGRPNGKHVGVPLSRGDFLSYSVTDQESLMR